MSIDQVPTIESLIGKPERVEPAEPSFTYSPVRLLPIFLPLRAVLTVAVLLFFLFGDIPARLPAILWIALALALLSVPAAYWLERRGLLEKRWVRWSVPALDILLITLLHIGSCGGEAPFFPLYYAPIVYAGLLAGYGGGLVAGVASLLAYSLAAWVGPRSDLTLGLVVGLLFPLGGMVSGYMGNYFLRLDARGAALLEQANRMRAEAEERRVVYERWYRAVDRLKADFVFSASHELRTPLTPIKGYLQFLLNPEYAVTEEKRQEYMRVMANNVDMLAELVDDIIYLQRVTRIPIDLGDVQVVDVARQAMEEMIGESEEAEVQIQLDSSPDLAPILGSSDSLALVLANLLESAIHDSPVGGAVTLSLRPADHGIEVRVTGAGRGIPTEHQERIFDLFFHADSSPTYVLGREGLNLAIARYIVEMHGGRITVENEVKGGIAFSVYLPGRAMDWRSEDGG